MSEPAEPGDLPRKHSYSGFSSWIRCGKAYELERVQRVVRHPAVYLEGGSAIHAWSEVYDRGIETPDIREMFLEAVAEVEESSETPRADWATAGRASKAKPNKEDIEWWLTELPLMAEKYVAWREATAWNIWEPTEGQLAIELDLEIPLGDEIIRMVIDRVFVIPRSEVLVVMDLKSGSREPDASTQLGLYATGIQMKFGVRPKYGYWYMARDGRHSKPIALAQWSPAVLSELYRQYSVGVQNRIFIPNVGSNCRTCSVSRFCALAKGANAKGVDSLAELTEVPF